jgi:hypothetical protein
MNVQHSVQEIGHYPLLDMISRRIKFYVHKK